MNNVYITNVGAYLPHEPISNNDIESVLGKIHGKSSRSRRIILRNNGIQTRHYAIDKLTGKATMNNAQLTAKAIEALNVQETVDLLATGTATPDQLIPNHGVMVHGELGWGCLEVVSTAGVCLSGTTALKYAYFGVKSGEAQRAIATGSERVSSQLLAHQFETESDDSENQLKTRAEIDFEKDFLRWMLSDGAGSVLLENQPQHPLSLKIHWIELFSYAHLLPACMYAGAEKNSDGSLTSWADIPINQRAERSTFAIKQDIRQLNDNIIPLTLIAPLKTIQARHGLKSDDVDWFLPHISSMYFATPVAQQLAEMNFCIQPEKWFTNLATSGNTGSASSFIALNELFHSGRIQTGQKLLMFIPESGRFSSGFVYLEAV